MTKKYFYSGLSAIKNLNYSWNCVATSRRLKINDRIDLVIDVAFTFNIYSIKTMVRYIGLNFSELYSSKKYNIICRVI